MASDPARALLEELVADGEPLIPYEDGNEVYCHWCDSAKPDDGKPFVHAASCLWLRVRAYLSSPSSSDKPGEEMPTATVTRRSSYEAKLPSEMRKFLKQMNEPSKFADDLLGCEHGRLPDQPCPHCMGINR